MTTIHTISEFSRPILDAWVEEHYGTADYEIVGSSRVLWSGWEADTDVAVIRLPDGSFKWALVDGPHAPDDVPEVLRKQLVAYRQAISNTEELLAMMSDQEPKPSSTTSASS